jgi:hypothetical protein
MDQWRRSRLVRLTPDEITLLECYRLCCEDHKRAALDFSHTAAVRCTRTHRPDNVVPFVAPWRRKLPKT